MIEMREKWSGAGYDLIDVFQILANSSNCNKEINLNGDLEVASIMIKYELSCADLSTCDPTPHTSLAVCSKHSEMHMHI